jgi:hypothetical protein
MFSSVIQIPKFATRYRGNMDTNFGIITLGPRGGNLPAAPGARLVCVQPIKGMQGPDRKFRVGGIDQNANFNF